MNSKIDLSNEDHCGQYALTKIEFKSSKYKSQKGSQQFYLYTPQREDPKGLTIFSFKTPPKI